MTEEDTIRLIESRHDIHAVADPSKLTGEAVYQAAVGASRDTLVASRADLVAKVAHNSQELSETDTERARVQTLLAKALDNYRYYRGRTKEALLNPPPDQPISVEEFDRRQRLYDRYYGPKPSDIGRLGLDKQVEWLEGLMTIYGEEKDLKNLGHLSALEAAFRPAIDAVTEFQRETQEDLKATSVLDQARAKFDRDHRAHIQQVESVLTRVDKDDDARYFIKRRDPAYAARRRAKAPVTQEPEAGSIESEIRGHNTVPA